MSDTYANPSSAASSEKEDTPRRASSMKQAFKNAFSPRKHSVSAEDLSLVRAGPEGGEKKKGGWMRKLSSRVMSPREKGRKGEAAGAVAPPKVVEATPEKEETPATIADVKAVVEGPAGKGTDSKQSEDVQAIVKDVVNAQHEAKEQVAQAADTSGVATKVDVPETNVDAAAAAHADETAAAVLHEVEEAHGKMVEPAYEAVATRDVNLSKVVFEEKKAETPKPKSSKKESGQKRRQGPLISLIGIAIGVTVIAVKMAK